MIRVSATYGYPGDACYVAVYNESRCIGTAFAPWEQWRNVALRLQDTGQIEVIDDPDYRNFVVPLLGSYIPIPKQEMDGFCDRLLEALYAAEVDKGGGVKRYYERYALASVQDGGCRALKERG